MTLLKRERCMMDEKMRRIVDRLAKRVLEYLNINIPIADMTLAVQQLKGIVVEDNTLSELSDGYVKKVAVDSDVCFEIHIPSGQNLYRKNFTIAHEIGHLIINMDYLDPDEWKKTNNDCHRARNTLQEEIADEFAAAFLMPEDLYKEQVERNTDKNGMVDVESIADFFKVSCNAAQTRGRCLGILS